MTSTLKEINTVPLNIISPLEDINVEISASAMSDEGTEKQILDLLAAPVSPNRITRHFENVFRQQRKAYAVRKVLLKNHNRIRLINHKFDLIAITSIRLIEIDETFKGMRVSLLVVIDTWTGYILHLSWLKKRSKAGILKALESVQSMFTEIMLVLTDGAPYFPEVVADLCPHAIHQICLVHVLRGLFKSLRSTQTPYKAAKKILNQIRTKQYDLKNTVQNRCQNLKKYKQKLKYWVIKRKAKRRALGVFPYQKGILTKYPELKYINDVINETQYKIKSMRNSVQNSQKTKIRLKTNLMQAEKEMHQTWGIYMTDWRFFHQFYNLFDLEPKHYSIARVKFIKLLQKSTSELGNEILRVLTTIKNLDAVKKLDSPVRLRKSFINTNMIESTNSRIRPHLEILRKIGDTEYCKAYFGLIRLYLNTCKVFSGFRKNTSPIERLGYDLRGRSYLDLIYHGFPSGPQHGLNSAKFNPSVVSPKRAKGCKIVSEGGV